LRMSTNSTFWKKINTKPPGRVTDKNADQEKFAEFNSKTDDAWDDGADLEFSIDPSEVIYGPGLSQLNLQNTLPREHDLVKHSERPKLLPRQSSVPSTPSSPTNIYYPPNPAEHSLAQPTTGDSVTENEAQGRHTVLHSVLLNKEESQRAKFKTILELECPDLEKLRKMAWFGCPKEYRAEVWKILSGYLPPNMSRRADTLARKRGEYWKYVDQYFKTRTDASFAGLYHQIHIDIPRTNPAVQLFQHMVVQEAFERVLYIWAYRNPGSGYVQGINDLVTPYYTVFLQHYISDNPETTDITKISDQDLRDVEADTYWCLSKLLDNVHDNYTFAQPGIQMKVHDLRRLVQRIDGALDAHLEKHLVEYLQFSFRWMNNLLMREMPLRCTVRLWDTYLSEPNGFSHFHLYVCAKFLTKWAHVVKSLADFQAVMIFLQSLPTSKWTDDDMTELISEAFQLKCLFPKAVTSVVGTP